MIILDGTNFQQIAQITPFESSFTGGVYVAAGDLTGDGINDVIITPDEGGGPRVLVYRGGAPGVQGSFDRVASFFGIEDANFRGGVRTAVADMNRDGTPDLVTGPGAGHAPEVRVFGGRTGAHVGAFPAFGPDMTAGVRVGLAYADGDDRADVVAATGPGGPATLRVFSGVTGRPVASRTSRWWCQTGAGRPSSACSSRCSGVDSQRSAPRTTWVTPWKASSTTTARW